MAGDLVVRDLVVRELGDDDMAAASELGRLAFGGGPPRPGPAEVGLPRPARTGWGAFDPSGRLVGKAVDVHHDQWWAGRRVAAADVAGVAVVPEARRAGVARRLLRALLAGARDRGAAVSALYPTASAVYRAGGWAVAGAARIVDIRTADLVAFRPEPGLTVRAGSPGDLAAVHGLYTAIARHRHGLLTRDARPDPVDVLPDGADGLTLVEEGDRLAAAALWQRYPGYGRDSVLTVPTVLASSPAAARAVLGVLASWRTVCPTLRLVLLADDAVSAELPLETAVEHRARRWMHRPVDVAAAVAQRGWPGRAGRVSFVLADAMAPWNAGAWELELAGGEGRLTPVAGTPTTRLHVEGFGLLYSGASSPAGLVERGLVRGAGPDELTGLGLLLPGTGAHLLDYF
jgi:predicted acetyltransferase